MRRFLHPRFVSAGLLLLGSAVAAHAAANITGTVIDKTNGKPAAGDQVTLIQLQQGMQESTKTTTDGHGRFSLQVPDEGMHLVRVTHQKANYFQPVQPGSSTADVTVYDAAPQVSGVTTGVQELHVEASSTELHIVEVLQVLNNSVPPRTQFGPDGFDFYLPKGALIGRTGAITQGGMPVQTPAVPRSDPGHFSFLFPIRPGETQFGIGYTLPYTGKFTFTPHLTSPVKTFAILVPEGMTLTPSGHVALNLQGTKQGVRTYLAQDVSPENPPEFTVTGSGNLPDQNAAGAGAGGDAPNASTANPPPGANGTAPNISNSDLAGGRGLNNPLDESGARDPWSKYKWWILSGIALLLAGAAGVLLRKPAAIPGAAADPARPSPPWDRPSPSSMYAPQPAPAATDDSTLLLRALKEELFALETERLQRRITEAEYIQARSAFELILRRSLERSGAADPARTVTQAIRGEASEAATLTDRPDDPQPSGSAAEFVSRG